MSPASTYLRWLTALQDRAHAARERASQSPGVEWMDNCARCCEADAEYVKALYEDATKDRAEGGE